MKTKKYSVLEQYKQLTISDDFMFCKIMQSDPDICKELIERILDKRIGGIISDNSQESIKLIHGGKGVRLDVYLEDDQNTVYDIEMQQAHSLDLPKRSRYYQGMIDLNMLKPGESYRKLKDSYIIFICPFDLFGKGLHKYEIAGRSIDNNTGIGDGAIRIFLNASGTADDISDGLKEFLQYVATGKTGGDFTRRLDEMIEKARSNEEWGIEYMSIRARDADNRDIGREEGRTEAIQKMLTIVTPEELIGAGFLKEEIDAAMSSLAPAAAK